MQVQYAATAGLLQHVCRARRLLRPNARFFTSRFPETFVLDFFPGKNRASRLPGRAVRKTAVVDLRKLKKKKKKIVRKVQQTHLAISESRRTGWVIKYMNNSCMFFLLTQKRCACVCVPSNAVLSAAGTGPIYS